MPPANACCGCVKRLETSHRILIMQLLGLIHAPTNLGLSPHPDGRERRPDKLPQALARSGLLDFIGATEVAALITITITPATRQLPTWRARTLPSSPGAAPSH